MIRTAILAAALAGASLASGGQALAQADSLSKPDTLPAARYRLEELTVVAYRRPTLPREAAVATSVITRATIESLPARTLADVLGLVPGLIFLDRDGAGQLPMAVARGFFGGGETEYVQLIVDGVPVNDVSTGAVQWTQVPLAYIDRIEVLRGGASTMYGDAAMGAVVSVFTGDGAGGSGFGGGASGGAWGDRSVHAAGSGNLGSGRLGANASWSRIAGFREHAASEDVSFSGSYRSGPGGPLGLFARAFARRLERDEPGPLRADEAAHDPRQDNPLFGSDQRRLGILDLAVGLSREVSAQRRLSWDAALRVFDDLNTRTLLLTPDFGDTQLRDERTWSLWNRLQYDVTFGGTSLLAGAEAEYGEYETGYSAPTAPMTSLASGAGGRLDLGMYAEGRQRVGRRWNGFAGLRLDVLDVRRAGPDAPRARYAELSPRVGANFAYSVAADRPGHVYAALTRSFKAPTLDQLYDVRELPAGEAAFSISNPDLRPQTSTGIEIGFNQRFPLGGSAFGELDLSLYRLTLEDEIDFDLSTFRFGNIQESRHDGLEVSLSATLSSQVTLHHSLNLMRVEFRGGEREGNRLKNVPGGAIVTALTVSPVRAFRLGLTHRYVAGLYLDDENAHRIPGYHTFGTRGDWSLGPATVFLSATNLFDERASSLGFLSFDPAAGAEVPFVYPIGGRAVRVGVSFRGSRG